MNLAAANGPSSIIFGLALLFTLGAMAVSFVWSILKRIFQPRRNREQW